MCGIEGIGIGVGIKLEAVERRECVDKVGQVYADYRAEQKRNELYFEIRSFEISQ